MPRRTHVPPLSMRVMATTVKSRTKGNLSRASRETRRLPRPRVSTLRSPTIRCISAAMIGRLRGSNGDGPSDKSRRACRSRKTVSISLINPSARRKAASATRDGARNSSSRASSSLRFSTTAGASSPFSGTGPNAASCDSSVPIRSALADRAEENCALNCAICIRN